MSGLLRAIAARQTEFLQEREAEGLQSLVDHSQNTLDTGTMVSHPGGKKSTIVTAGVQDRRLNEGRETVIPTLWNGRIYDLRVPEEREQVIQFALQSGRKWPSGDSVAEGETLNIFAKSVINKQTPAGEQ